jgi:hypothetical protein
MTQALVESLTDANHHEEAKEVVVKSEGKTKWSDDLYQSESFNPDEKVSSFAREVARECDYDGDDIINAYFFLTKMAGSKVATMIEDLLLKPKTTKSTSSSKLKKYIDNADINFVVLKIKGKTVTISGSDVLNGANLLEDGGDLTKIAFYVPKRDVIEVILKNGETIKPVNGYWVKKGYEPITRTSSTPKAPAKGKVTSPNYPNVNFNHKVVINGKTINLALAKSYVTGLNGSRQYDFIDVDGNPMTGYGFSVKEALKQVENFGNNPMYYSQTTNTPPKIDETKAHFKMDLSDGKWEVFVDSNFVNQSQGNLPNTELKHYGYGDFYLQTPDGNIDFIRTSEEKKGFVGRTHKMKGSDELVLKLVNAMKEKGRFESTQTFADGGFMNNVYAKGGKMQVNNIDAELEDFDIDNLDPFETMQYNQFVKSLGKVGALQVLINSVEGNYSELSPELAELAEKQISGQEWEEQYYRDNGYAKGGTVGSYDVVIDGDWDEPKKFKTFSLAKKWIYENIKNHDSLELVDAYGDTIYVEGNSTKEDLDWLFSNDSVSFSDGGSVGDMVSIELNNGKVITGKLEKISPVKIRINESSTQVLPNSLIKSIKKLNYANGGSFEDNYGFMRADNENNYRFPERPVHVDTLDEPIDLTDNVSYKSNEVVIEPVDQDMNMNEDGRIRARMTQSNRGSAENFAKINPNSFEFILMPTSNKHKND